MEKVHLSSSQHTLNLSSSLETPITLLKETQRLKGEEKKLALMKLKKSFEKNLSNELLGPRAAVELELSFFELDPAAKRSNIETAEELLRKIPREKLPREWAVVAAKILFQKGLYEKNQQERLLSKALAILEPFHDDTLSDDEKFTLIAILFAKASSANLRSGKKRFILWIESLLSKCPKSHNQKCLEPHLAWLKVESGDLPRNEALETILKLISAIPPEEERTSDHSELLAEILKATKTFLEKASIQALEKENLNEKQAMLKDLEEILKKLPPLDSNHCLRLTVGHLLADTMEGEERKKKLETVLNIYDSLPKTSETQAVYLQANYQYALCLQGNEQKAKLLEIEKLLKDHPNLIKLEYFHAIIQTELSNHEKNKEIIQQRLKKANNHFKRFSENVSLFLKKKSLKKEIVQSVNKEGLSEKKAELKAMEEKLKKLPPLDANIAYLFALKKDKIKKENLKKIESHRDHDPHVQNSFNPLKRKKIK